MKVLIVSTCDLYGGAARAANRLHRALIAQGVDSRMLVQDKRSRDTTVIGPKMKLKRWLALSRFLIDKLPNVFYWKRDSVLFSSSWFGFSDTVKTINRINPDIVHLHWIAGGMMRIEDIARIKAPVVWSLHDSWAFTGGCHVIWDCDRYLKQCGACPRLGSHHEEDISRSVFRRKARAYDQKKDMTIVGLSRWIRDCSQGSPLLGGKKHVQLPNPIDTDVYQPYDKREARKLWNLPQDKKLVLFGALSAISDTNKGYRELTQALDKLQPSNLELVIFGDSGPHGENIFGYKTHYLGIINDDVSLVKLYNAADVMVVPSLQESFGQMVSESLSCGTPVVCFAGSGPDDIVDHKQNGYLAKPYDSEDLSRGIDWVLNHPHYDKVCEKARSKVVRKFDSRIVAKKYINLYREIWGGGNDRVRSLAATMKVLMVNACDLYGGAARAANRLHRALLAQGVNSRMLVQDKRSRDATVIGPEMKLKRWLALSRFLIDKLPNVLYRKKDPVLFSSSWFGFSNTVKTINRINPDIVHLHWITGGMMRIEDIARIKAPIIWSLHDNWAFTGGCHIMWGCERYQEQCGACPRLGSQGEKDLSRSVFQRKAMSYDQKREMTIVGLSRWVRDCSQRSSLLGGKRHVHLPNPIDTEIYQPYDRREVRRWWRLPQKKKLILFGALSAMSDINKGYKELVPALGDLRLKDLELVVFGSNGPQGREDLGFKVNYLGVIKDDVSLVKLYNAADVMVVPSLQENLSNAIMESLACATPVVGFDIGGNGDMVEHKRNGYLAKPFDPEDLARGIEWVLSHPHYDKVCKEARSKVMREFDSRVVAEKYTTLYQDILGRKTR